MVCRQPADTAEPVAWSPAAAEGRATGLAILDYFERTTRLLLGLAIVATAASALLVASGAPPVATFGVTAVALAILASLVGEGTEQLGARKGPAAIVLPTMPCARR